MWNTWPVKAQSDSVHTSSLVLTNAVYEDQTEIENVEDSEGYEELVESVSQLFS